MSPHQELAETFAHLTRPRPLLVRLVDVESDRCVREFRVDPSWTGLEIRQWAQWLESVCGDGYRTEIPTETSTEERSR